MIPFRRSTAAFALAVLAALAAFSLASCAKNDLFGQGLELWIGVKGASPQGVGASPGWAVDAIDSILFVQDVDSTALAVSSFIETDSLGVPVPGTVRFAPSNLFVEYFQPWPNTSVFFLTGQGATTRAIGKVYFIPARPRSGHRTYTYQLTTGVRMQAGKLIRDVETFSFTTGDSVASRAPAARPS